MYIHTYIRKMPGDMKNNAHETSMTNNVQF